jgi:hypothetical protein
MGKAINIITIFFVVVVLAAIFLHACQRQQLKAEIAKLSDAEYILNSLKLRGADDCKVTPIADGWRCVEVKNDCGNGAPDFCGRIFIVRRPM